MSGEHTGDGWEVDDVVDVKVDAPPIDRPVVGGPRRRAGARIGASVPGAIAGLFLVCTLAFGATLTGSGAPFDTTDLPAADVADGAGGANADPPPADDVIGEEPGPDEPGADEPAAEEPVTGEPGADEPGTDQPGAGEPGADEPDATPKPDPKPEPKPEPKPTPTEKPHLGLVLSIREGAVFIDWTSCEVPGADLYKVVRSSDSTVRWPMGENDHLVKTVEVGGPTKAWDEHARPGKRNYYRVFCFRAGETGYKVVALSSVKSIVAPAEPTPPPNPEPAALWIELGTEGNAVVIHWEACTSDNFSHYRILRKTDGEPTLLAEVESASNTTYVDETVESGIEYHYLVQAKGHVGDDWVLLGATGWAGIVAP